MAEQSQNPTSGADELLPDAYGIEDQEPDQLGQDEPEASGSQGFMSADDVQRLLDNQRQMLEEQSQRYTQTLAQMVQPPQSQAQPQVQMPTADEVREAFERGDGNAFMDVYSRSLQAMHAATEARVAALEQAGMARINELSQNVVNTSIPDYERYKKDVETIMDEYQIGQDLRANPKVVKLLVDAAKGRNMDQEVSMAIEARQRQAAQRQTAEPTSQRSPNAREPEEPVFGMAALQALRNAGRSPDQHAQQLGYSSWEDYVAATNDKYDNWQERSVPAWRKRLNERRQSTGRRAG